MRKRRTVAWLLAVAVGMMLVPAMNASAASKHETKQNAAIGKATKASAKALRRIAALTTVVTQHTAALSDLDTRVKAIEGGVPQVLKGLNDLKDGLTAAGAGLTSLKTLATSTEYGIGQVTIGGTPAAGSFVETPNIPDDVQQAQTTVSFNAGASGGTIGLLVGVRSNESDGTGASNPAAHCRVTVVDSNGHTTTSLPTPAGAGIGTAPFYPINNKSTVTSTDPANAGFPFGPKTSGADADSLVNLTDTTSGTPNAAAPDGTAATAVPGKSYSVSLSCVDLSPSSTDPSA